MKKTLLFITTSFGYGGASKVLTFVAASLSQLGYNVHIVNIMTTSNEILQNIPEEIVVHTAVSSKARGFRRFDQLIKVKRIAKSIQADVIIGFTYYPNIIASLVGRQLGIKSIISERGDPYHTIGEGFISKVMLSIINNADGGVFQTEGAMKYYSERLQRKSRVIANPIFKPSCEVLERDALDIHKTVVSVGRLDNAQKRYDVMLKSFALFSKYYPDYVLRLIGDGPDENEIRQWCVDFGIVDKVQFVGRSSHPLNDIVQDGMFLITSDYEGISNALLEAMSVGLPCVSTDHSPGGARYLIEDHINGLLAPIGDCKKIAAAMSEFADNPALAELCGHNALKVNERFAPCRIIAEWDRYIVDICNEG